MYARSVCVVWSHARSISQKKLYNWQRSRSGSAIANFAWILSNKVRNYANPFYIYCYVDVANLLTTVKRARSFAACAVLPAQRKLRCKDIFSLACVLILREKTIHSYIRETKRSRMLSFIERNLWISQQRVGLLRSRIFAVVLLRENRNLKINS